MNFESNSVCAYIVGPTGCGKTTFINLLMRFYDTDKGDILVDGQPIKNVTRHSLRSNYGMVLQDTWIKSGTVRENICIEAQMPLMRDQRGSKKRHSWEFIRRLPDGLDISSHRGQLGHRARNSFLRITRVMPCRRPC